MPHILISSDTGEVLGEIDVEMLPVPPDKATLWIAISSRSWASAPEDGTAQVSTAAHKKYVTRVYACGSFSVFTTDATCDELKPFRWFRPVADTEDLKLADSLERVLADRVGAGMFFPGMADDARNYARYLRERDECRRRR